MMELWHAKVDMMGRSGGGCKVKVDMVLVPVGGAHRGGEAVGLLDWFWGVMVIRPKHGLGERKKSLD
jgi:hypothetical protein